jgi:hypothetical protein
VLLVDPTAAHRTAQCIADYAYVSKKQGESSEQTPVAPKKCCSAASAMDMGIVVAAIHAWCCLRYGSSKSGDLSYIAFDFHKECGATNYGR